MRQLRQLARWLGLKLILWASEPTNGPECEVPEEPIEDSAEDPELKAWLREYDHNSDAAPVG